MKNLMLFVSPKKDLPEEYETAIKIQIDNSLSLGWKIEDLIFATNFPYEYKGVKSVLVSSDNYCDFNATVTIFNVIVELFTRDLIEKDQLYWYHDHDVWEFSKITESELNLDKADLAIVDRGPKPKLDTGLIYFKSGAENIFRFVKELCYKYQINEEYAITALYTNNLLWITDTEYSAQHKFTPLNIPGAEDVPNRIKKLDLRYLFPLGYFDLIYEKAKKPIKVAHFHFSSDRLLDSAMYGKNSAKKVLMPERLIKIFHKHGVKGLFPKKMKNLMIYLNPEKKFPAKEEDLVKTQIDNSLKLGWKKEDIIFLTNFPYEYHGVKAMVIDDKTNKAGAIFHLLDQKIVKEGELWWYHDLDVFQRRPIKSSEINLDGTTAGFIDYGQNKFYFGSFFFRKGSEKLFEWIRNRAARLDTDETAALASLSTANYRNINTMYKKLKLVKLFKKHKIKGF